MHIVELSGPALDQFRRVDHRDHDAPAPGRAQIRMRTAGLNFIDLAVATGSYPTGGFPLIPVADGAGEVIATGEGVDNVVVGDRVVIHPKARWIAGAADAVRTSAMRGVTQPGSLREIADVNAATLVKLPDHLSWEEAGTLPIGVATGWSALKSAAIGPGSTVVLTGTGGTALATLQLAKASGARVIVTTSSAERAERVTALGADDVVDYRAVPDWHQAVLDLTGGQGADLVFDAAGTDTFPRSIKAARAGRTIFSIGFVTGSQTSINLFDIIGGARRVIGGNTGSVESLQAGIDTIARHAIHPLVAQTFAVADIADAYRAPQAGGIFGKVAITLNW